MKRTQAQTTADAANILRRRLKSATAETSAKLDHIRADDTVARKIHDLRVNAGLSQRQLAELVGTTASVICRLEDSDYEGHSLAMLNRIAGALDKRVEIHFVSRSSRASAKAAAAR